MSEIAHLGVLLLLVTLLHYDAVACTVLDLMPLTATHKSQQSQAHDFASCLLAHGVHYVNKQSRGKTDNCMRTYLSMQVSVLGVGLAESYSAGGGPH